MTVKYFQLMGITLIIGKLVECWFNCITAHHRKKNTISHTVEKYTDLLEKAFLSSGYLLIVET